AIVTGGAGGIGSAVAEMFAREGALVTVADIDISRAGEIAATIEKAIAHEVDVTSAESVERLVAETVERRGRLDIMVNNAGIENPVVDILDMSDDAYLRTIAVNQNGCFYGIRAAGRAMRENGGVIVNTASVYGVLAARGQVPYVASKAAVIAMTRAAARDLARYNIRVVAIAPGLVETPLSREFLADPRAWEAVERGHLRRKAARPDDIARLATFLAGDEAAFLNGHVYFADDGYATFKP
ncbi:MAG TPA: SDR family oxidoreductase, partial [Chloroflexota bacterium]|nr:SDR family oxidoreductase [Chloroflexota bacterium]